MDEKLRSQLLHLRQLFVAEPLLLQPRQRLVDGAEREVALREADDLVVNGNAVRRVADAQHCEKDDLFELAEHGTYLVDNVENMGGRRSPQARCVEPFITLAALFESHRWVKAQPVE